MERQQIGERKIITGPEPERRSMSVQNDKQALWSQDETHSEEHAFQGSDFVLIEEGNRRLVSSWHASGCLSLACISASYEA